MTTAMIKYLMVDRYKLESMDTPRTRKCWSMSYNNCLGKCKVRAPVFQVLSQSPEVPFRHAAGFDIPVHLLVLIKGASEMRSIRRLLSRCIFRSSRRKLVSEIMVSFQDGQFAFQLPFGLNGVERQGPHGATVKYTPTEFQSGKNFLDFRAAQNPANGFDVLRTRKTPLNLGRLSTSNLCNFLVS